MGSKKRARFPLVRNWHECDLLAERTNLVYEGQTNHGQRRRGASKVWRQKVGGKIR